MIPEGLRLTGEHVDLQPLGREHARDLLTHCRDPRIWEFTALKSPFTSLPCSEAWIDEIRTLPGEAGFAIIDRASGKAIGATFYMDIHPENRKIEIGRTFIDPRFWRSPVNTECKFLLLRYAFETAGALRVQLKAVATNTRSRTAIARLGAVYEGTLRNFRCDRGKPVDSAFYSILDSEWPAVGERLRSFLNADYGAEKRMPAST